MAYGYNSRLLRVNLSTRQTSTEEPAESVFRRYLGGGGLGCYYLLREVDAGVDALSADNKLILMTSVINGTPLSGCNRYSAIAKSPLTEGYGESEAGGYWGPELKAAGFDGIIIEGCAEQPVYLYVHDETCEIRDASPYWGKLADETQHGLEDEIGSKRIRVLQTGIAGENRVRFAALVNQQRHFHGRSGLGAVMGSKQLKAVVCRGRGKLQPARKEDFREILHWFRETYDQEGDMRHKLGTAQILKVLDADGILPTHNFRDGTFEKADDISGQRMRETILTDAGTCFACAVACKREVEVEGTDVTPEYGGPEYETVAAHGSLQGIGDMNFIATANKKLAQYVLDSISTGVAVAFAMECFEEGIIDEKDTDGLELRFGNQEASLAIIDMIAHRQGIGDILAEGVMRAAKVFGNGAERFAMHVKGQELPMHEPRGKRSLALAYSTSATGADHMEAPHDTFFESLDNDSPLAEIGLTEPVDRLDMGSKKVRAYYYAKQVWGLYDSIGMCDFVGAPISDLTLGKLVAYVSAVTGWNVSLWELLKAAERAHNLKRAFNVRAGFRPADDDLPGRMFEPLTSGALEGVAIDRADFDEMRNLFYGVAGWDGETGFPTRAKLAELDLDWVEEYRPA